MLRGQPSATSKFPKRQQRRRRRRVVLSTLHTPAMAAATEGGGGSHGCYTRQLKLAVVPHLLLQPLPGNVAVGVQLPRVLARDRHPGRDVRQLHTIADLVYFLPTRPAALFFFFIPRKVHWLCNWVSDLRKHFNWDTICTKLVEHQSQRGNESSWAYVHMMMTKKEKCPQQMIIYKLIQQQGHALPMGLLLRCVQLENMQHQPMGSYVQIRLVSWYTCINCCR